MKILKFYRLPRLACGAIAIKFTLRASSKRAVAMKFYAAFLGNARVRAPAKAVNLARNFIPPHSLSGYQICLPSGRGEISHCPSMRARSKISRSRFSGPYSKRSTYRAGPSRNTRLRQPVLEAGTIKFRALSFDSRSKISAACCRKIRTTAPVRGSV